MMGLLGGRRAAIITRITSVRASSSSCSSATYCTSGNCDVRRLLSARAA